VADASHPSNLGGRDWENQGQPGQIVHETPIVGGGGLSLSSQATWEAEIRRTAVPG
jgi:hypothetical protein